MRFSHCGIPLFFGRFCLFGWLGGIRPLLDGCLGLHPNDGGVIPEILHEIPHTAREVAHLRAYGGIVIHKPLGIPLAALLEEEMIVMMLEAHLLILYLLGEDIVIQHRRLEARKECRIHILAGVILLLHHISRFL